MSAVRARMTRTIDAIARRIYDGPDVPTLDERDWSHRPSM